MKKERKEEWLHIAETLDAIRLIPRVFLAICLTWTIWLTVYLVSWYCALPTAARGFEASGFGAAALWATFAFLNKVYDRYTAGGRDWSVQPAPASTTTTTTTGAAP